MSLKSRSPGDQRTSISCYDVPDKLIHNKTLTKHHFQKFGKVLRIVLRPKKKHCIIEYEDPECAQRAIYDSGNFEGIFFRTGWTRHKSSDKKKVIDDEQKDPTWLPDPDVQAELAALQGYTVSKSYNLRPEGMAVDSPVLVDKTIVRKHALLSKPVRQRPVEKSVRKKPKDIKTVLNIANNNSEQIAELLKIIMQPAQTSEEKYRLLDARDKLIRLRSVRQSDLTNVKRMVGTCPDMCPEKERLMREAQHQVALYEQTGPGKNLMNHSVAVKQYSRSSADQEAPLAHDLRPVSVLQLTMGYLLHRIMDLCDSPDVNLGEWYHFLWDRTRGIRKDITQQELCCQGSVCLVEQCARFHIHCSARLVSEDVSVFDQKINTENLTKCLQTLKYMYHDLALQGEKCPNEAEFRGYIVLLNLNDGNFMWEVQQLSDVIQCSPEVKFALQVYSALDKDNYVRFFKLVRSTTYLNACILLRYFNQVRYRAIIRILKSYSPRQPYMQFPIAELSNILAFEDDNSTTEFLEYYGLYSNEEGTHVILDRKTFQHPDLPFQLDRAINVIESKKTCSVGEIVCGSTLPPKHYENIIPHDSFDAAGYLKKSEIPTGIELNAIEEQESVSKIQQAGMEVDKPYTFCAPVIETSANIAIPSVPTNFIFQSPTNVVVTSAEQEKSSAPKSTGSIFSSSIPDNSQTNFTNLFNKVEPMKSFWNSGNFEKPKLTSAENDKYVFKSDQLEMPKTTMEERTKMFTFAPASDTPDTSVNLFIPSQNLKETAKDVTDNAEKNSKLQKMKLLRDQMIKQNAEKLKAETIRQTEEKRKKQAEAIRRQRELEELHRIEERKKIELDIEIKRKAVINSLMQDILDEVENRETDRKLAEEKLKYIRGNIQKRKTIFYFNKWRNILYLSKKKRKNFFDNPTWVSTRSVQNEAKELYMPNQNILLQDMKRYKLGLASPLVNYLPVKRDIFDIDIFKTSWKILFEKLSNLENCPHLDIFWKIGISLPKKEGAHIQRLHKTMQNTFHWKANKNFLKVEHFNAINGGTFTSCVKKIFIDKTPDNDFSGIFFIEFSSNLQSVHERLINILLKNNLVNVPVFVLILGHTDFNTISLIEDMKSLLSNFTSKYEIMNCRNGSLINESHIVTGLQWLASNVNTPLALEMDTLKSLVHVFSGNEFWSRLKASAEINHHFKRLLIDANFCIDLYNMSLDNLKKTIFNSEFENYPNFPKEFKKFLKKSKNLPFPLEYKHFPSYWRDVDFLKRLKSVVDDLHLPYFEEIEICSKNMLIEVAEMYCLKVFKDKSVFLKIYASLIPYFNLIDEPNFDKPFSWSDIIQIFVEEKIKNINIYDECTNRILAAVYKIDTLREYRKCPWWYLCPSVSAKLKAINEEKTCEEHFSEDSDEEIVDITQEISIYEKEQSDDDSIDEKKKNIKEDLKDIANILEDLQKTCQIQKQFTDVFNRTFLNSLQDKCD